jgi:C1A family cysteine protease
MLLFALSYRFDVYDDLNSFFNTSGNANKVYRPSDTAKFLYAHAVVLVGYSNDEDQPYWLAKNSWGTSWADGGFFKVLCCLLARFLVN